MRKILPFFMSTLLVIFVASYWVLNYTGNNADLADGKTYVITVENGMTAADIANMLHSTNIFGENPVLLFLTEDLDLFNHIIGVQTLG